jgi:hypothetical protein
MDITNKHLALILDILDWELVDTNSANSLGKNLLNTEDVEKDDMKKIMHAYYNARRCKNMKESVATLLHYCDFYFPLVDTIEMFIDAQKEKKAFKSIP